MNNTKQKIIDLLLSRQKSLDNIRAHSMTGKEIGANAYMINVLTAQISMLKDVLKIIRSEE